MLSGYFLLRIINLQRTKIPSTIRGQYPFNDLALFVRAEGIARISKYFVIEFQLKGNLVAGEIINGIVDDIML